MSIQWCASRYALDFELQTESRTNAKVVAAHQEAECRGLM
jgi:hypothetical protein